MTGKSAMRTLLLLTAFAGTAKATPDDVAWLGQLATEMRSIAFARKDAEAYMGRHADLFEKVGFQDEHPAYTGCAHLLRIEAYPVASARPALGAIENLFGPAKEIPTSPDDFSGRKTYAFYPTAGGGEVFVRIFAEVRGDGPPRIVRFSVDREKRCP